jgi:GAF domain-containing protein
MIPSSPVPQPNRFKRLISPPRFNSEEQTRVAQYLNVILLATITLLALRVLLGAIEKGLQLVLSEIVMLGLMLVCIALWLVMRRGYLRIVSMLFLSVALISMAYVASESEGVFDSAYLALIALIPMAGLLLGWKAALVLTLADMVVAWWLAIADADQAFVLAAGSTIGYARDLTFVLILIGVLIYVLISSLTQAVTSARASEHNLREQNVELARLQTDLEERVAVRTDQLTTSVEVGRVAASILDPERLLDEIVNVIADRFHFYYVAIFTLNELGDSAVLRAATGEAGRILKERSHKLSLGTDSMVGYAITKRRPRVASDVGKDAVHFANPLLPQTRSEVALPLTVGDQILGALNVQSTVPAAFDEASVAVLQSLTNQIAVALSNARSYENVRRALDSTQRQFEVSRALFEARTPQEAYEALGQVWSLLPELDRLQIYLVKERGPDGRPSQYELSIEWDVIGGVQADLQQTYAVEQLPILTLGQFDRVTIISNIVDPQVSRSARAILRDAGVQAALLAPLHVRQQFEGMLIILAERPIEFTESQINLLTTMTDQLTIVLNDLRLVEEMKATVHRMELLNQQLSGAAWERYLSGQAELTVESGHPAPASALNRVEVPIQVRGQTVGRFALEDANADRPWSADDLTLFQTVANEVALAVDNARLIEQTQRTAQREKDIALAADKIHRASNLEEILQTAVQELSRITGLPDIAIQFGAADSSGNGQRA